LDTLFFQCCRDKRPVRHGGFHYSNEKGCDARYLEAHGFGLDRYIEDSLVLEKGMALAPTRPGHGVNFDWKALAELAA